MVDYGTGISPYVAMDALNRVVVAKYSDWSVLFTPTYNSLGQMTSLGHGASNAGGSTTIAQDGLGRVTSYGNDIDGSLTTNDITWTFAYNPAGQVANWSATSSVYDYKETQTGTVGQTYDGLNRDAAIAAMSGGYDARGNLANEGTAPGKRAFTYDAFNRLLTVADGATPTV